MLKIIVLVLVIYTFQLSAQTKKKPNIIFIMSIT